MLKFQMDLSCMFFGIKRVIVNSHLKGQTPCINSPPNNKILDWTYADKKLHVAEIVISVFDRDKKYHGKRRKCCFTVYLYSPQ